MKCKKCGSENVQVQRVSVTTKKKKGLVYWLCFVWVIDILAFLFLTVPYLIVKIFKSKKIKTDMHSESVCQDCGYAWKT